MQLASHPVNSLAPKIKVVMLVKARRFMFKSTLIVSALLLGAFALFAQQQAAPTPAAPSSDARSQGNPVKPTPDSIAKGKKMYDIDCAMCHGKDGDGKGDLAADMKPKVTDFTSADEMGNTTDPQLFKIIKDGKGQMPPEGDRVKTEELWNMVNYIRTFAKK
jgi:mono/diheme cytochrome c family protein